MESRSRRRRRWLLWPGLGLILAGLAMLGWVAWELWGTNIASRKHQREAIGQLQLGWVHGQHLVQTPWGTASAIIKIPRFGASYQVPVFEGTSQDVLAAGYGHFTGTAQPGQVGNYALAAHRITHGEPLRNMPELRPGDDVVVETRLTTYTYRLVNAGGSLVVPFTAGWVLHPLPTNPQPGGIEPPQKPGERLLTLTTCSELFHTDNRMIAFGVLVSRKPTF